MCLYFLLNGTQVKMEHYTGKKRRITGILGQTIRYRFLVNTEPPALILRGMFK
jgi:hypothetical protein